MDLFSNTETWPRAGDAPGGRQSPSLAREQLLERIIELNPTAEVTFLDSFSTPTLRRYLDRLLGALGPREPSPTWQRPGDTPAITARTRRA